MVNQRDPRHDILFEPVKIGPVTAKNRFYQVPHCSGLGNVHPSAHAAMRGVKAEGGWAVVCPEETGIHPSGDIVPSIELRLWDDREIPALARIVDAVHEHDALAGVELNHSGPETPNLYSREVPIGPSDQVITMAAPVQARAMDKQDIRNLRRWHRDAARRARTAGFDIIYVYAGKFLTMLTFFLSRRYNHRTDEYGGSLENRCRLLRELLEGAKEEVGDTCGIVCRIRFDDDHYYMGGVLAELLRDKDCDVTLITPAADVSNWTHNTMEQYRIQRKLMNLGVTIIPHRAVSEVKSGSVVTTCVYTDAEQEHTCDGVLMVTSRRPDNSLYHQLMARQEDWQLANIHSVHVIGDANAPGTIASATFAGRRYAEELDTPDIGDAVPFKRELTALS